jgi:hypothetical protein
MDSVNVSFPLHEDIIEVVLNKNLSVIQRIAIETVCKVWCKIISTPDYLNEKLEEKKSLKELPILGQLPRCVLEACRGMKSIFSMPRWNFKKIIFQDDTILPNETLAFDVNSGCFRLKVYDTNRKISLLCLFSSVAPGRFKPSRTIEEWTLSFQSPDHYTLLRSENERHFSFFTQLVAGEQAMIKGVAYHLDSAENKIKFEADDVKAIKAKHHITDVDLALRQAAAGKLQVDLADFRMLCRHADVNAARSNDNTALHWVTKCGQKERFHRVKALVESGASTNTTNLQGLIPLDYAENFQGDGVDMYELSLHMILQRKTI